MLFLNKVYEKIIMTSEIQVKIMKLSSLFGKGFTSVFKCSNSTGFAYEVLHEVMVHFCKTWRLSNDSQVVDAKPEAKFL